LCVLFILTMGGRAVTIDVAKQDEAEKLHKVRRDESSLERESLEDEDKGVSGNSETIGGLVVGAVGEESCSVSIGETKGLEHSLEHSREERPPGTPPAQVMAMPAAHSPPPAPKKAYPHQRKRNRKLKSEGVARRLEF